MKIVRLDALDWADWRSPGGKFHGRGRQVSAALGARPNANLADGGHPFDLEYGRLAPGKSGCPFHSHSSQWELYVIAAGEGVMRTGAERRAVRAGDAVLCPPGDAHELRNTGTADLDYFLVADNPAVDVWRYPDSKKWGFRPGGGIFLPTPVDYHHGEDDDPSLPPPAPPKGPDTSLPSLARFVTIDAIPETEQRSPKGTYRSFARDISLALGGVRDTGVWGGGHPFDLQHRRVPPGAAVCPLHAHGVQWELFVALAGAATVQSGPDKHAVKAGDVFLQTPGTAHQIVNTGAEDFRFYVIADNHPADHTFYPNSGKWMLKPGRKIFRMTETDYFDGEE